MTTKTIKTKSNSSLMINCLITLLTLIGMLLLSTSMYAQSDNEINITINGEEITQPITLIFNLEDLTNKKMLNGSIKIENEEVELDLPKKISINSEFENLSLSLYTEENNKKKFLLKDNKWQDVKE